MIELCPPTLCRRGSDSRISRRCAAARAPIPIFHCLSARGVVGRGVHASHVIELDRKRKCSRVLYDRAHTHASIRACNIPSSMDQSNQPPNPTDRNREHADAYTLYGGEKKQRSRENQHAITVKCNQCAGTHYQYGCSDSMQFIRNTSTNDLDLFK